MKQTAGKIGLRKCMALMIALMLILAQTSLALATKSAPSPETSPGPTATPAKAAAPSPTATPAKAAAPSPSPSPTPAQPLGSKAEGAGPVLNLTNPSKIGSVPSQGGLFSGMLPDGGIPFSPASYGTPEGEVPLTPTTYGAPAGVSIIQKVSLDGVNLKDSVKLSSTQTQVTFHYEIAVTEEAESIEIGGELFSCVIGDAFSNIPDITVDLTGDLELTYDRAEKKIIVKKVADNFTATPYNISFTADVAPGALATLTLEGTAITVERAASISINMGWDAFGTTKGNATFDLLNSEDTSVATATITETVTSCVLELYPSERESGTYKLRQTLDSPTTDYTPCADRSIELIKDATGLTLSYESSEPAGVLTLSYTNKSSHEGSITIMAVNKTNNGKPFTGASFKLERYVTDVYVPYPGGSGIATVDDSGSLVFDNLPDGVYKITQMSLDGYTILVNSVEVEIDSGSTAEDLVKVHVFDKDNLPGIIDVKKALTLTWESEQLFGSYTFIAVDSAGAALVGAGFTLYYPNQAGDGPGSDIYAPQVLSDADGKVLFSALAYGKYYIVLTKAPPGYNIDHTPGESRDINISGTAEQPGADWLIERATGEISFLFKDSSDKGIGGGSFALNIHTTINSIPVPLKRDGTTAVGTVNNVPVYSYDEGSTAADANVFETEGGYAHIKGLPMSITQVVSSSVSVEYDNYIITAKKLPAGYTDAGAGVSGNIVFDRTSLVKDISLTGYPYALKLSAIYTNETKIDRALIGAEFKIKKSDSEYVSATGPSTGLHTFTGLVAGNLATTFTTGSDGSFLLELLPEGNYTIELTAAPAGYATKSSISVSIGQNPQNVSDGRVTYEEKSEFDRDNKSLEIKAVDQQKKPITGATYTLYKVDGDKEYPVYLGAPDTNGVMTFTGLGDEGDTDATGLTPSGTNATTLITGLPEGDYKLKQTTTPAGHETMSFMPFSVSASLAPSLLAMSALTVSANIPIKFVNASVTPNISLDGAEFVVKKVNSDGSKVQLMFDQSGNNYTLSSSGLSEIPAGLAGVILRGLGEGDYEIVQTVVPDGFVNPAVDQATPFTVTYDDHSTLMEDLVISNVLETHEISFSIIKQDAADKKPLSGATFQLQKLVTGTTYNPVKSLTTSTSGTVQFTELTEGTYRIEETTAPSGYTKWPDALRFTVDSAGVVRVITDSRTEILDPVSDDYPNMYSLPITNKKALTRNFAVKCASSTTGAVISGATFTLTSAGGTTQTLTTGSNGETSYVALEYGSYTLKQTGSAIGFQAGTTSYTVLVNESGVTVNGSTAGITTADNKYLFTLTNAPGSRSAMIYVRDGSSWVPLSGAVFNVSQKNAGNAWTLTSNANGYTGTFTITPGYSYDISQTTAPSNYLLPSSGWTLTVAAGGGVSVTGSGITAYEQDGTLILRIDNTYTSSGSGGGGDSGSDSDSGGGTPGIPRTGQHVNTDLITLGAAIMLVSGAGLVLFMIKSRRREG